MRLVSFNTLHGLSPRDGRVDLARFAAAVRALDADVLALQEVDRGQARSGHADLAGVAATAMGAATHRFAPTRHRRAHLWPRSAGGHRRASYGVALLSRWPVLDWEVVALPRARPSAVRRGRLRWRLVREERRAAIVAVVETPEGPMTVVGTHLAVAAASARRQLVDLVARVVDRPRPLVVLGDLNLRAEPAARLSGLRPLAALATYPVDEPSVQIDHALADGELLVTAAHAVDTGLSDHRALVVDVTRG